MAKASNQAVEDFNITTLIAKSDDPVTLLQNADVTCRTKKHIPDKQTTLTCKFYSDLNYDGTTLDGRIRGQSNIWLLCQKDLDLPWSCWIDLF